MAKVFPSYCLLSNGNAQTVCFTLKYKACVYKHYFIHGMTGWMLVSKMAFNALTLMIFAGIFVALKKKKIGFQVTIRNNYNVQ